jgi:ribonucleoside-diphosphate reductase alpha chain
LTEINASDITTQEELNARARAASFVGTLQAGYTDFHYLREGWRTQTEQEALLGVSMTGIASGNVDRLSLAEAARVVLEENERVAKLIGINKAARACAIKPAGTTSLVVGSSSGIHAWHNKYYIRRIRVGKNEAIYKYILETNPSLVVDDYEKPHLQGIFEFPQKAPLNAITRDEDTMNFLERIKKFNLEWVREGHRGGSNFHNVSATVYVKPGEWETVGKWMWDNKEHYTGLSVLPYNGGTYAQAPFEDIGETQYNEMVKRLESIDLHDVYEDEDNTNLSAEAACAGGACEIK